jgi:valyl-tRNA synthetase
MADLPKTYDPKSVEPKWYQHWIANRDFEANPQSSKLPFSIVIPPPNITGVLTLGHVLNNTIQDILVRRARMQGFEALWLPGTDHAGVGTQTAVEKHLRRTEKKTRHDLGREEFLRRVLEWQDKHGGIIIEQLKRLGCSCDWSRQRYTFDEKYTRAVHDAFFNLYNKGLIYRGRRMINWDPAAQTALSDEEVISKPQTGNLYYVRYEIVEERGRFIEVATTRPETIMADTAVAVHPKDERYTALIGKHAWRPLGRERLPVIADEAIDPEFGTGALKVTPGHDIVDFQIGERHNLPILDVLTPQGRIDSPAVPELHGLDRFEAREKAAALLKKRNLLVKIEPYQNNVGFSDRSEVPIEPRISEQWFLRYPKTKEALAVVRDHLIRFFPAHWEKVYTQWLENIQEWCISRQVWWGHRIPVWRGSFNVSWGDLVDLITSARAAAILSQGSEARNMTVRINGQVVSELDKDRYPPSLDVGPYGVVICTAPEKIGRYFEAIGLEQDPDTLDTWFSSWLWAYETMDEETRKKFYPTSVLVTAPDIIFFWVARMIIAGLEFKPAKSERIEDNIPFRHVYFTGLIRDKQGRKMSKSLGNSPDPLELIEKYGADGLRFGLMRTAPRGQDIRFDEKQIEEGRNFATKLWNAARFRQMHGPSLPLAQIDRHQFSIYAIEVLARLNETIDAIDAAYREYHFNAAAQRLYDFFWSDYCDWFVEAAKTDIFGDNQSRKSSALAVMDFVLSAVLRLLHPFMPHITEELWFLLSLGEGTIQFTPPPEKMTLDEADLSTKQRLVSAIYGTVQAGRNLRSETGIPSNQKVNFVLRTDSAQLDGELATMTRLLNAAELRLDRDQRAEPDVPMAVTPLGEIFLVMTGRDRSAERHRLDKEISKIETELQAVGLKLKNQSFIERAPAAVVEEHQKRQKNFSEQLAKLKQARESLG